MKTTSEKRRAGAAEARKHYRMQAKAPAMLAVLKDLVAGNVQDELKDRARKIIYDIESEE